MRHVPSVIRSNVCLLATTLVMTSGPSAQSSRPSSLATLQTRAERTNFTETSRYDDVQSFLATVDAASDLVHVSTFGYTFEGRPLLLAVVGRVADARPATVLASSRLRVYLQANIHAGEVEGKEAVLALVRDIAVGQHADWLQSLVLLVNPNYNADGNERVTLTSRGFQHGPIGGQGTRPNAQGLNINRDDIKLETPEARSMVRLLNDFDPHVMIDLHTTNGSRHAYHLTYETPNNPAVEGGIVRQSRDWMAAVSQGRQEQGRLGVPVLRERERHGAEPGLDHGGGFAALHPQLLGHAQPLRHPERDLLVSSVRRTGHHQPPVPGRGARLCARQCGDIEEDGRDRRRQLARRPAPVDPLEGGARHSADRDPDGRRGGRGESVLGPHHAQAHEPADARADGRRDDL